MRKRFLIPVFLATVFSAPSLAQDSCDLQLVLAMDVSRSVNPEEFRLLQKGTADAFRSGDVVEIIGWLSGGVYVTVTQWSSARQQRQVVPWRLLTTPKSVFDFAREIEDMRRRYRFDLTAPGNALLHAENLIRQSTTQCRRQVIDIAGDGIKNTGLEVAKVASDISARGVVINGLVIRGDSPDPLPFYRDEIARGPLSFVQVAEGFDDFPRAILKKLLRELPPSLSLAPVEPPRISPS